MRAIKMWVAVHPTQSNNCEVTFYDPKEDGVHVYSNREDEEGFWVEYVEYVCFPIQEGLGEQA